VVALSTARVIFVNRYFAPDHSATSQIASDLAMDLASRGVEVVAITSRQQYENPAARMARNERIGGVHIMRVWTTAFGRSGLLGRAFDYLSFYVSASWRLFREASRGSVIVAMTDPPLIAIPAFWIARLRGAALVNWIQDLFPEVAERLGVMRRGALYRLLQRLRDGALRGANANVVIGDRMAEYVASVHGAAAVLVIPNWALEELDGSDGTSPLRAAWHLGDRFVVGYSGNMGRAHRLEVLIEAADRLRDNPRIVFLLVGSGAQKAALESDVKRRGLGNVLFKPYQPRSELRFSLLVPDIHVVSLDARLEGLIVPSKFVGVIALGRPVLCLGDARGELGRLTQTAGCGLVLSDDSPVAIADAVAALAADADRLHNMAQRAHTLWHTRFRRRAAHDAWHALLTSRAEAVASSAEGRA
jgi:glycosyltransferase involved in cell wall biosynthesis